MHLKCLQDNDMCPEENKLEKFTEIENIFIVFKQKKQRKKEENSKII